MHGLLFIRKGGVVSEYYGCVSTELTLHPYENLQYSFDLTFVSIFLYTCTLIPPLRFP